MRETLLDVSQSERPTPRGSARTFGGRYRVLSKLGEGGMGAVFQVVDLELDEEVALKVLHSAYAETEGALERFRREVKLARRVTHPNVARVYDLGAAEGVRFLTMELIIGESLAEHLQTRERLPLPDALRIVEDIARGLAVAHAAGVVHRDLKPDNILLDARARSELGAERVVLTDFGIAVLAAGIGASADATSELVGTPEFMAPEQVEGLEPDGRADVYSLGVVLFHLLTRRFPFDGASPYLVAAAKLANNAPKLRSLDKTVPEPVANLADAMLARFREARPDMLRVLETIEMLRGAARPYDLVHRPITERFRDRRGGLLVVRPFDAPDVASAPLARNLSNAVGDALSRLPGARVVPPVTVRAANTKPGLDAIEIGRRFSGTHVVEGSAETEGGRTRVRVRAIDLATGLQVWAAKFESAGPRLPLEDEVCRAAVDALAAILPSDEAPPPSPDDADRALPPEARALYGRGVAAAREYGDHIERGVEALREANQLAPNNPYVMSALGAALVRLWSFSGKSPLLVEAEEWSLRALATGTRIGETFATIGVLRLHQGQLRAGVDAFREACARSPLLSEPHSYLGRLMSESGNLEAATRRLERAVELDPGDHHARAELARIAAMQQEWDRADAILDEAASAAPHASGILLATKVRFTVWRNEPSKLASAVDAFESRRDDPSLRYVVRMVLPLWRALANRESLAEDDPRLEVLREAARDGSLRLTMFWYQLLAEIGGVAGHVDSALEAIEAAAMRTLIDVHWLNRCPALEPLRADVRMSRARAAVAARAAALWR